MSDEQWSKKVVDNIVFGKEALGLWDMLSDQHAT
jgi:hypothetical protein